MSADLYQELGVARDASPEAIKAAHRKRAKATHPDRGGEREAFERVQRAAVVLTDPVRRARYDQTGAADEAPSQDRTDAMVADAVASLIVMLINSPVVLETTDVPKTVRAVLDQKRREVEATVATLRQQLKRCETLASRVQRKGRRSRRGRDGHDVLTGVIGGVLAQAREKLDAGEQGLDVHTRVEGVFASMGYRFDAPAPVTSIPARLFVNIMMP